MGRTLKASKQDERLSIIDRAIRDRHQPSLEDILEAVNAAGDSAGKRTVQEDLRVLRERHGAPLVARRIPANQPGGRRYYYAYDHPSWRLEIDLLTEQDLQAIRLARDLLKHCQNIPDVDELERSYNKLVRMADPDAETRAGAAPGLPIAFSPLVPQRIDPDVWRVVLQAIQEKKAIRMVYDKRAAWSRTGPTDRLVDPYHVVNLGGTWYLLGSAELTKPELRQYSLSKIRSAKITKAPVTTEMPFPIDKALKTTFGRFIGDPNHTVTVTVRFSKRVRALVRGELFHPGQHTTRHRDGRTTVSFPVSPLGAEPEWRYYHVRSWILSWGADVEVLMPIELKAMVREDVVQMYSAST